MNPAELRKRVTLLESSFIQNSYGETENTWNDIATVWAKIQPLQGRELYLAKQVHAELTTKITIRYRAGVLPSMRIRYGSHIYQIISPPINIDERNRLLEILCKEVI